MSELKLCFRLMGISFLQSTRRCLTVNSVTPQNSQIGGSFRSKRCLCVARQCPILRRQITISFLLLTLFPDFQTFVSDLINLNLLVVTRTSFHSFDHFLIWINFKKFLMSSQVIMCSILDCIELLAAVSTMSFSRIPQ
uniref:Uncharacterized protein n=1 Tax=Cacopsylla melanoneura TaxID=428564 RepID=A0A8D8UY66_9HEMI